MTVKTKAIFPDNNNGGTGCDYRQGMVLFDMHHQRYFACSWKLTDVLKQNL